ncbi:hypothetical protein [Maritalea sp. S77]|uniref:hypothetical protein n=1 Tax=Maritalea sp. S77 TaxID=3415125 RepID=UPI003C7BED36
MTWRVPNAEADELKIIRLLDEAYAADIRRIKEEQSSNEKNKPEPDHISAVLDAE